MVAWGEIGKMPTADSSPSVSVALRAMAVVRAGGTPALRGPTVGTRFSEMGKRITICGQESRSFRALWGVEVWLSCVRLPFLIWSGLSRLGSLPETFPRTGPY